MRRSPSVDGSPFVTGDAALALIVTASRWSVRPSSLLGLEDEVIAYCLDEALALRAATTSEPAREGYDDPRSVARPGPVAPGPAAHLVRP